MRNLTLKIIFSSLSILIIAQGCTSSKHYLSQNNGNPYVVDENTKEITKGFGEIKLLPHQLTPLDYLAKHPNKKGLVINHYMGTGKTYLGLGFAQMHPKKSVLIIAPRFIESNWQELTSKYKVTNPKRFTFVSYKDAPKKLINKDLSEHIIIADEVHNIIRHLRSPDDNTAEQYSKVYEKLRSAYKILALTGTPAYEDESDIAFITNLVTKEDVLPFNKEKFRLKFTSIKTVRQFFRGYVGESQIFMGAAMLTLSLTFAAAFGMAFIPIGMALGVLPPILSMAFINTDNFKLREISANKLRPVLANNYSYFKFDDSHFKNFPNIKISTKEVSYNRQQYSFFLHLVEGDLPVKHLKRILSSSDREYSDEFVKLNSSSLHKKAYEQIGGGRDIGNYQFLDRNNNMIEPPKFEAIYKELIDKKEQSVIYSNYDKTGIREFAKFLRRKNYPYSFAIIHPDMKPNELNAIVSDYNSEKIKLLLLHPEITEGISLLGTQYLHILEPVANPTVLEQIIGRTRRLNSHMHLPENKRTVNVYIWKSTSSNWNFEISDIKRANWFKRYRELSYLSRFGLGITQIDKNYDKKVYNPEELAIIKMDTLKRNLDEIQNVLSKESIEANYVK